MASKKELRVSLDIEAYRLLEKRAKKNFLSVSEMVSEIIRRSIISMKRKGIASTGEADDKFVEYFSRRK